MEHIRNHRSVYAYAALFLVLAFTLAVPVGLAWAQEAPAGAATSK